MGIAVSGGQAQGCSGAYQSLQLDIGEYKTGSLGQLGESRRDHLSESMLRKKKKTIDNKN